MLCHSVYNCVKEESSLVFFYCRINVIEKREEDKKLVHSNVCHFESMGKRDSVIFVLILYLTNK